MKRNTRARSTTTIESAKSEVKKPLISHFVLVVALRARVSRFALCPTNPPVLQARQTHRLLQLFSVHTTPEEFENATIAGHFGFVFEEYSGRVIT